MERQLIHYLPDLVRDYAELFGIMAGEQPEFERAWAAADGLLDDQFIQTAGTLGISRLESMLGIQPRGTDSLEERRQRVLARFREDLPFTMRVLEQLLAAFCGPEGYYIILEPGSYLLQIEVALAAERNFHEIEEMLQRVVPMNMEIHLDLMYDHPATRIEIHTTLTAYKFNLGRAGTYNAGTRPYRNMESGLSDAQIGAEAREEGFAYQVPFAGTKPYPTTEVTGGGLQPLVMSEAFPYQVKRCGTAATTST